MERAQVPDEKEREEKIVQEGKKKGAITAQQLGNCKTSPLFGGREKKNVVTLATDGGKKKKKKLSHQLEGPAHPEGTVGISPQRRE